MQRASWIGMTVATACGALLLGHAARVEGQTASETAATTQKPPVRAPAKAPSAKKPTKKAPVLKKPPVRRIKKTQPSGGVDLTLGACVVECNDGTGYSAALCTSNGYRSDYKFRAWPSPNLKNAGTQAATFAAGKKVWSANGDSPSPALAPSTGLYLAAGASAPGPNQPYKLMQNLAPGTYTVAFKADPDDVIQETNENNNESTCSWTVVPKPPNTAADLTITSVVVTPSSGPSTTAFQHTVIVKNVGNDPASAGFHTRCTPGSGWNQTNLAAGATHSRTLPIPNVSSIPPGTHTITCTVSSFSSEPNTTNNTKTATFTITP